MPLELKKDKKGQYRKYWYGRYKVNGRRYLVNLDIRVAGTPPKSLRQIGEPAFERSRAQAQSRLDAIVEQAKGRKNTEHILQQLYEIKTGSTLHEAELSTLPKDWLKIPRSRRISEAHSKQSVKVLERFVAYIQTNYRHIQYLSQVSKTIAHSFLKKESDRGIAPKTYNDILKLLRSAFVKLLNGSPNPFEAVPTRTSDPIYRKPFTAAELTKILEVSENMPFIRPIIVVGISTAMRRGDCCLLRWGQVDLKEDFISVKTAKTGHTAEIPILPILREELMKALSQSKSSVCPDDYVFPQQAEMYLNNPDGITWRVRQLLKEVGFEKDMQMERTQGIRKASVKAFHSFRVTWITLALSAGIPLELVQRVTGHQTTEIVRKHYFQPNRDNFRQALHDKMPDLMRGDNN